MEIDLFWEKLKQYEGETFRTVSDLPFVYEFVGENSIKTNRANQLLSKSNFEKALRVEPIQSPGEISNLVRGSSYVFSLLTDERLK